MSDLEDLCHIIIVHLMVIFLIILYKRYKPLKVHSLEEYHITEYILKGCGWAVHSFVLFSFGTKVPITFLQFMKKFHLIGVLLHHTWNNWSPLRSPKNNDNWVDFVVSISPLNESICFSQEKNSNFWVFFFFC